MHNGVSDHELRIEMITNCRIAMNAVHHERLAETAIGDHLLQCRVLGIEAPHEADLDQLPAERLLLSHDRMGGCDVGCQRLFTQHRDTPIKAGIELFRMRITWGCNEHRIHVRIVDRRDRVTLDACPNLLSDFGCLVCQEVIDDRDCGATYAAGECINVKSAHYADAKDGDFQLVTHRCLPNSMLAPLQEV